jgi:hypothetical protein
MTYRPEQVEELERERQLVLGELEDLWLALAHEFAPKLMVERAQEYVGHGVCRRLKTIHRCIDNIFTIFPPERTKLLSEEERYDLQINLHAFTINISGLPDSLAWVYVIEKSLEKVVEGGRSGVGLFNENTKKYLPPEVRAYLDSEGIKNWHKDYAKNYRDALAHRIPLYVPPSIWKPGHEQRYRELEEEIRVELKKPNSDRAQTLRVEQDTLGSICPYFLHSFSDINAPSPVIIHPQVIVDAKTVMEIVRVFRRNVP